MRVDNIRSFSRPHSRHSAVSPSRCKSSSFTKDQWLFLVLFFSSSIMQEGIAFLPGPLYPTEAEKKGLPPSIYGAVMGTAGFAMCFSTILGAYIGKIGLREVYIAGIFFDGLSPVLFGLLDYINSYSLFVSLSFFVRAMEGIAIIAIECSAYPMLFTIFEGSIGSAISVIETGHLMGSMLGPFIGTAIFSQFGYATTFMSFGFVQIGTCFLVYFTLPKAPKQDEGDMSVKEVLKGYRAILKVPTVAMFVIGSFISEMGMEFVVTILEPGLREHNLSSIGVGLMFFTFGVLNILAPLWGLLLDKISRSELIVATSFLILCTSVALLGPIPFIPISRTYTLTICALLLFGLGQGMVNVSSIVNLQLEVEHKQMGSMESVNNAFVPIIFVTTSGLGWLVGSSAAGVLYEDFGFKRALIFVFTTHLIMGSLIFLHMASRKCRPRTIPESNSYENQPLLSIK